MLIIILCFSLLSVFINNSDKEVFADKVNEELSLEEECRQMTESIEINVDGDVHNISEYESYLSEEFQFGEKFEERPKRQN